MPTPVKIKSEEEYLVLMQRIEGLLQSATQNGGFAAMPEQQRATLQALSLAAEAWEDDRQLMPIPHPKTLAEMIVFKMYERKLKQKDLAQMLDISPARLSEILNGKRKVNLLLAKRLHEQLDIDAAFILKAA
jgi:HTH-type transcriptional regulator / antitoxin HigA